jgi:nucleotide-binding universal stress UspA family protein
MAIKDLLVHLDPSPATEARLQAALALAERFGAEVEALHLIPEPFMPGVVGHHMPDEVLREHLARVEAEAEGMVAAARAAAARRGVTLTIVRASGPVDRLPSLLARHARHADLTVVGRPDRAASGVDDALLVEAAFLDSGHPALVIPPADPDSAALLPPRRVLVAWDGSREAARAVADALPLLRCADSVTVLVVDGPDVPKGAGDHAPGAEIARHLARHEVKAQVKRVARGGAGTGAVILGQAQEEAADLLVMGGYGHSRFREMLLGGTTRAILERATVPVLISH